MTTEKMMDWDEKFSVDIEEVDIYQQKMFELFNQLIELKENKKDAKECINLISEINEASKQYFAIEEKILRKNKFPDFSTHSKAHREFTKRSIALRREIAEDINNLTTDVIIELRQWLIDHIETLDALYVPFIRITDYIKSTEKKKLK